MRFFIRATQLFCVFQAVLGAMFPITTFASILPANNLYLEDGQSKRELFVESSHPKLTLAVVQPIFDAFQQQYAPLAKQFGATFEVEYNRESSSVNAIATRQKNKWVVIIHGGFVRRPEMTADALVIALCHEAGHLFGGYPFVSKDNLSSEGQADYFATQVCARALWSKQSTLNEILGKNVSSFEKQKCDNAWPGNEIEQNLCYRIALASNPLAILLARIFDEDATPAFDTPALNIAPVTLFDEYPSIQCRLDTFFHGALCDVSHTANLIPGFRFESEINLTLNTLESERVSRQHSCYEKANIGNRPSCWFKPIQPSDFESLVVN